MFLILTYDILYLTNRRKANQLSRKKNLFVQTDDYQTVLPLRKFNTPKHKKKQLKSPKFKNWVKVTESIDFKNFVNAVLLY